MQSQVSIEALVDESFTIIQDIRNKQRAADEERTLASIPKANADFQSDAARRDNLYLANTRNEVFQALEDWVTNLSRDKPICILTGGAGTGKSTIASEFSRRMKARGLLGASYFFLRDEEGLNSTERFFSTLAYQLAELQDTLRPHVLAAVRDHSGVDPDPQGLLMRPLRAVAKPHRPIFLVIDALDECRDPSPRGTDRAPDTVPDLLHRLFACVREFPFYLRIFITSRPGLHYIDDSLASSEADCVHPFSLDDIPPEQVTRDIRAFISSKLLANHKSREWCIRESNVVPDLTERSAGFFIYASTAVRFLLDDPDDLDARLNTLLSPNDAPGLDALHKLYQRVLETVVPPASQIPERKKQITFVLGCVAVHLDQTPPRILEVLIGTPPERRGIIASILKKLRAVVLFEHSNPDAHFRAIHVTFCDFLLALSAPSPTGGYSIEAAPLHAQLARNCLECLSEPGAGRDTWESENAYNLAHVRYARQNWHIHVSQASGPEIRDLVAVLTKLVNDDDKWARSWLMEVRFALDVYWSIERKGLHNVFQWVHDHISEDVARRLAERMKKTVIGLDVKFLGKGKVDVSLQVPPIFRTKRFFEDTINQPPRFGPARQRT